jgi:CRP/FNR family cyclic AMP-dependent transcriptional regulator
MVQAEAAERFLSAPWLTDVEPGARREVIEAMVEERAAAGSVLLAQGQPNDHLSFLIGGTATVERSRPGAGAGAGGRTETLATLHAPSVFGTTSFFTPSPPSVRVRAATDVWLLTLHHAAHDRLRRDHPQAAEALAVTAIRVLSERFNELDRLFSEYMAGHPESPKVTEWAGFRARLFEEPAG